MTEDQDEEKESYYEAYGQLYAGDLGTDPVKELEYLHSGVKEILDDIEGHKTDREGRYLLNPEESIRILTYFAITAGTIERLSCIYLRETIIAEDQKSRKRTDKFLKEDLTQNQRKELLFRCGLIEPEQNQYMSEVQSFRNDILHNPRKRKLVDDEQTLKTLADNALRAVRGIWTTLEETIEE